ncbi:Rieske domain-containing protein isoform X2 [Takifugu flavidus]|uniref:Rieske domain-containing protein isoform X2 n=1 Tax=Takifugu flavidus TaxID=433684 RepID=UPI00254411EF|nr:Rieske domain-containing protein isoform X2 [Takifugu flavidus]
MDAAAAAASGRTETPLMAAQLKRARCATWNIFHAAGGQTHSQQGGPLCEGDIEEVEGVLQVFCPWHDYNFDLRTGKSGTSLQQNVYEVKQEDGNVHVKHSGRLSLEPFPVGRRS